MQFFQTNIEALQGINPNLAQSLVAIDEVKNFEIFMDEGEVATLNFVHTKHFIPLYEGSPATSIEEQKQEYSKVSKYPYLYFYGIANGVLLKELLQNLQHKRILVIEQDLEILYVVFHMIDFSQEIQEGRFVLLAAQQADFPTLVNYFLDYQEHKYARVYELYINTSYYEKLYFEHIQTCNRIFIEAIYHSVNIAGNDTADALIGLKHHIANLATVLQTPPLVELVEKLHTCESAVLVSTGPSLTKQLPLLKQIAPYVRIIAVDASFPVLYKAGIKPDVVVSIERVQESARFFQEVPKEGFEDVVFALSSLQHRDVVESIKGGTIQMSLRPLGFMMYTGPQEWGFLGIGQSAANMAYELIYHAKFKNCILIGQDLAYSPDGKSHASGHVFGEENVKTKEGDVWIKAWGDQGQVRTNHTWDMFRKSFEKDIGETKARMLTVNATQGGASIYGTLEISFSDAIERFVATKKIKEKLQLRRIVSSERAGVIAQTWQKVETMQGYIEQIFEQSRSAFLQIAPALEKDKESYTNKQLQELVSFADAIKARHKEEIYDKVAWHIAQSTMLSKEIELAPAEVYLAEDEVAEKERLWHLLEAYKPWLFLFSGIMSAIAKTITYARVRTQYENVDTVDVYIQDQKIDTIDRKSLTAQYGKVFDVDVRGILYDVADTYQEKIGAVTFKDAQTKQKLPSEFVSVITRGDEKYNELCFLKSLDREKKSVEEELYQANSIGFLAIEDNLQELSFIEYMQELLQRYPQVAINGFIFNEKQKEQASLYFKDQNNLSFIIIDDITDILRNSEIYFALQYSHIDFSIRDYIQSYTTEILFLDYRANWHGKSFTPLPAKVIANIELFGVKECQTYTSLQEFFYTSIMKKLGKKEYVFDKTKDLYQLVYYDTVKYVVDIKGFKNLYLEFRKTLSTIK